MKELLVSILLTLVVGVGVGAFAKPSNYHPTHGIMAKAAVDFERSVKDFSEQEKKNMKKLLVSILLILVVGVGAFAKPFVVFADEESLQPNYHPTHGIMAKAAVDFERSVKDFSEQEKKKTTFIVVYDKFGPLYEIWVSKKPKNGDFTPFVVVVSDGCARYMATYSCCTLDKNPDPVQIGLTFVKTQAFLIIDAEEDVVTFEAADETIEYKAFLDKENN